jgi:hypothetical protein
MDDARPPLGSAGQCGTSRDQRVDQGVVPVSRGRVNYQTGRLVDDGEMLVLEDDGEGKCAGLDGAGRLVLRDPDRDLLTPREESRSSSWFAFDADSFVGD